LVFANVTLKYNTTRIHCIATFNSSSGEITTAMSNDSLLLVQGKLKY
jgi:hypothetical protein